MEAVNGAEKRWRRGADDAWRNAGWGRRARRVRGCPASCRRRVGGGARVDAAESGAWRRARHWPWPIAIGIQRRHRAISKRTRAANGLRLSSGGTGSLIPIRSGSRSIVCSTSFVESERGLGRRTGRFSRAVRHPNSVVLLLFSCEFPHSLRSPGVSRDPATRMRNEGRRRACTGKPARARRAGTWWAKASVPSPSRFRPASRDTGSARVRSRRSAGR